MKKQKRGVELIGRRVFLRGSASVVVALPFLESFWPRGVAEAQRPAHRFVVFMRQGNGVQQGLGQEPDRFWPSALGPLTTRGMQADSGRAVSVLAEIAPKLLVVRGCEMRAIQDAGCGHASGGLLCLTAARANGRNVQKSLATGESIDNRIERELSGPGREPLTLRAGPRSSFLDDVLSYRSSGNRRVAESNPFNAYRVLFGVPASATAGQKAGLRQKSVNDLVRAEFAQILSGSKLSRSDRDRIAQHQQAIRDLELGMACALPPELLDPLSRVTTAQAQSDAGILQTVKLQSQVIALAMACGKAHAVTLQIGNGNDQTQYTIKGKKYERYHHISHRINSDGTNGTAIADADLKHHEIDRLFASVFLDLVRELDARKTPTGTLLDDGVAIWLNDLSNGPPHSTRNMPYVCAGSCGGALKNGVYVDAADVAANRYVTHNKFLNTIAAAVGCKNAAGAPLDDFGDPTLQKGRIPQMLA